MKEPELLGHFVKKADFYKRERDSRFMTYTSLNFYVFLLAVLILYYIVPLRFRWIALLAGSAAFYFIAYKTGWWLLLASIIVTYILGLYLDELKEKYPQSKYRQKRAVFTVAVMLVLIPWFCIKQGNFILVFLLHRMPLGWIVPLGLSFYTLQSISYLADIYQGKIRAQRNPAKYALFILFFPQIIQGPIPRYGHLAEQLYEGHAFDEDKFIKGFQLILWGFFLKFMIADKAAIVVNEVFVYPDKYTGGYVLTAAVLYSIQLYTDFLACFVISRGVAELFGIDLADNFKRPYFAVSIKDFWRRWHISLSNWLRDYVYIPLGGSRKGKLTTYANLVITFAVSGIWHGAGIRFLFWGFLHALYQIAGRLTSGIQDRIYNFLKLEKQSLGRKSLQRIGVFFWVTLGWIIFRADSLSIGLRMIKNMFFVHNPWIFFNDQIFSLGLEWKEWCVLAGALLLLAFVEQKQEAGVCIREYIISRPVYFRFFVYTAAILCVMIFGTYGFGFNAQDFIYGGF